MDALSTSKDAHRAIMPFTVPQSSSAMPPRPEFTPFTAPCLVSADALYDGLDFWAYPTRAGWTIDAVDKNCHLFCSPGLCRGDSGEHSRVADSTSYLPSRLVSRTDGTPVTGASKAAFLQGWLFFGVLTEVSRMCGLAVDVREEFVVEDGRAVSTAALNGLAGRWFAALPSKHVADMAFMDSLLAIARQVSLLLNEDGDRGSSSQAPRYTYTHAEARVFHAIDTLLRVLGLHLLLHAYSPEFSTEDPAAEENLIRLKGRIRVAIDWPERRVEAYDALTDSMLDEMLERGWCDSELSLLATDEIPFASLLERPRARDHSRCGDVVCSAYQTDEATYKTVHVKNDCECDFLRVPPGDLAEYLARGKVPALIVEENLEMRVVGSMDYPYIALSHVWADGLGNTLDNALPTCQVRRIRGYLNELHHRLRGTRSNSAPLAFWMDTLCIPVDPSMRAHRKKAIQLLGKTFNDARGVLVLDRELEIINSAEAAFLELGIRILCSGWIKRLWTLQEAVLASAAHGENKLYFQMRDGPFLYEKYDRHKERSREPGIPEALMEEREFLCEDGVILLLGEQIPSARAVRDTRRGWSQLAAVFNAVEHRTTSKAEDVPVCMASILGLDVAPILAAQDMEGRVAAFYLLVRAVPDRIMWFERLATLRRAPFRWAPLSLAACPQSAFRRGDNAVCDVRGLHVSYLGFLLDVPRARERYAVLPPRFRLVPASANAGSGPPYGFLWPSLRSATVPLEPTHRLAIVVRSSLPEAVEPNAAVIKVECDENEDGEIVGTVLARMMFAMESLDAPEVQDGDDLIPCMATAWPQKWCIT